MPDRMIIMNQYQKVWREIWTDGRELPKNVGAAEKGSPDPRYYGYSVGHWEGDSTFVVDTTGLDENTWLNGDGYPHSVDAHVQERFTRVDHNDLQLTVTVTDPKLYTKPFVLGKSAFKWLPKQNLEEQLCIPSDMIQYLSLIGDPGGKGVEEVRNLDRYDPQIGRHGEFMKSRCDIRDCRICAWISSSLHPHRGCSAAGRRTAARLPATDA